MTEKATAYLNQVNDFVKTIDTNKFKEYEEKLQEMRRLEIELIGVNYQLTCFRKNALIRDKIMELRDSDELVILAKSFEEEVLKIYSFFESNELSNQFCYRNVKNLDPKYLPIFSSIESLVCSCSSYTFIFNCYNALSEIKKMLDSITSIIRSYDQVILPA